MLPSEKSYITCQTSSSKPTLPAQLPCWYDRWLAERQLSEKQKERQQQASDDSGNDEEESIPDGGFIEPAELQLSVVFPAYNEEKRIIPTLEEAVEYLDEHFGRPVGGKKKGGNKKQHTGRHARDGQTNGGYEIIIVNDGSTDKTVDVVLEFAGKNNLKDVIRVVTLSRNRGKGGSVTHGLRHVRGEYALFADADGASKFSDVRKLIEGCEEVVDGSHRGVAIGSRAHLVGSDAVVKVRHTPSPSPSLNLESIQTNMTSTSARPCATS